MLAGKFYPLLPLLMLCLFHIIINPSLGFTAISTKARRVTRPTVGAETFSSLPALHLVHPKYLWFPVVAVGRNQFWWELGKIFPFGP